MTSTTAAGFLEEIRALIPADWKLDDTFGLDYSLTCPHGEVLTADVERCSRGCWTPLRGTKFGRPTPAEEDLAEADSWLSKALDAVRRADERLVLAALRLLCLQAQEDNPTAVTIELEWSDQGDFLSVYELVDVAGESIEWEDDSSLAWNFEGHTERYWAAFMTTHANGNRFHLDIIDTLAAIGAPEASDLVSRVDQVLARSAEIDADWAAATVTDEDPLAKVWQADDDARRELSYDAVDVLREVRAALTPTQE